MKNDGSGIIKETVKKPIGRLVKPMRGLAGWIPWMLSGRKTTTRGAQRLDGSRAFSFFSLSPLEPQVPALYGVL